MKDFFEAMSRFNIADRECHDFKITTWTANLPPNVRDAIDRRSKAIADAEVALDTYIDGRVRHIVPLVPLWDADYKRKTGQK